MPPSLPFLFVFHLSVWQTVVLPRLARPAGRSNSNDRKKSCSSLHIFIPCSLVYLQNYKGDFTRFHPSLVETHRDGVSEGLHPVVLQDHVLVLHEHNQVAQCVSATQWKITGSIFICNEFCFGILTF
jgi:hypothetical protein